MTENKHPNPSPTSGLKTTSDTTIVKKHSVGVTGLHARLRNPEAVAVNDPNTKPNRMALLVDVSGSMQGQKITSLRDACASFVQSCDFSDTALALEPFGDDGGNRVALTCFEPMLSTTIQMLQATGSTPMARAMGYALNTYSMTRTVLVSDGQPDSEGEAYSEASHYREAGIMIDCVHIGDSTGGESCLRRIAEMTGGQFIKFTDIASFARSFKYLTPKFYAQLTSGNVTAAQLGAKELK